MWGLGSSRNRAAVSMAVQYLFNSSGSWIAFRKGRYVFDSTGKWIGWLPWDDAELVDVNGKYLGTIVSGKRFYRFLNRPYRGYPGYPGYPGYHYSRNESSCYENVQDVYRASIEKRGEH